MEAVGTIASRIVQLLEKSETKRLAGSQLRTLLNFEFPGFKPEIYGCANLRQFVTQHVPAVGELGRAGADLVYGMNPPEQIVTLPATNANASTSAIETQATPQAPAPEVEVFLDPSVWKTFASPSARYKLFGNSQTGDLQVVPPGGQIPTSPWIRIPPCSESTHLQIAKEFISTLSEESHRLSLGDELGKPRWWDAYFLRAQQLGLLDSWGVFRRHRLTREFESTLKSLGIPSVPYPETPPRSRPATRLRGVGLRPIPAGSEISKLRGLAVSAVQQMSIAELRALMLPLGYVADGLNEI